MKTRQTILVLFGLFKLFNYASIPFRFETTFVEKVWYVSIIPIISIIATNFITEFLLNGINMAVDRFEVINNLYKSQEHVPEHREILLRYLKSLRKAFKIIPIFLAVVYHMPLAAGLILAWWKQKFIYSVSFYVVFMDRHSLSGFVVNTILQLMATSLVYVCMMSFNLYHLFITTQVIPMTNIYCFKLREIGKLLVTKNRITTNPRLVLKFAHQLKFATVNQKLLNFVREYENYTNYIDMLTKTRGKFLYLVVVSISAAAIGLSGFLAWKYSISIGLFLFIIYFLNIALFCVFGTLMEHQNKKLLDEFYNFPWFELSESQKKIFLQMLMVLQDSRQINTWIIGNLKVELLTTILNSSYSYLMFLINFS
jgi:hypothetical protein